MVSWVTPRLQIFLLLSMSLYSKHKKVFQEDVEYVVGRSYSVPVV